MSRFVSRHPIIFSVLVVLLAMALITLVGAAFTYLKLSEFTNQLIVEVVFCGYVILLLTRLHWWHEAGFKKPTTRRKYLAYLPLVFLPLVVVVISGFKAASPSTVMWFALFTLLAGFAEEGLLRGVVLRAMLPSDLKRAVLVSSLIFGLAHLINIWQGHSAATVIIQIIYATLLGIGFAGARLYTGTIWPAIVIHALIDFVDFGSRGFVLALPQTVTLTGVIFTIVITSLYALYGWWLLRRTKTGVAAA
jgi:uncharacterized protein